MNPRIALSLIAIFLCSMGLPFAEYGTGDKEEERLKEITTHEKWSSSSNMAFNITGFQEGSVYSNQTVAFAGGAVCQIIDGEVWCDGVGMAYFSGYMFGNRSMVENWPSNPEFLGNVPDYDLLDEPYRIDMLPENRHVISIHRGNGWGSTCAVLDDGSLTCWGHGSQWIEKAQQDGFSTYTLPTLTLPNSQKIIAMDIGGWTVGGEFACVLTDRSYDNTYCFPMWDAYGNFSDVNQRGELGLGYVNASGTITTTLANHTYSALEMYGGKATSISAGRRHACAIVESTSVLQKTFKPMCWGDNNFGQVGNGSMNAESLSILDPNYYSVSPTNASVGTLGLNAPMAMSLSHYFSCALLQKGDVSCWGGVHAEWGEDSDGNWGYSSDAYEVTLSNAMTGQAIALYTSPTQVCVLSSTGEANCWQRETDSWGYGKMNSTHPRIINLKQNGVEPVTLQGDDMVTTIQTDNRGRKICTLMENGTYSCYQTNSTEAYVYTDEHDVWNGTMSNHRLIENKSVLFKERDSDGDGVPLFRDLCPYEAVPVIGCTDADGDGKPDQFESDLDDDGVPNSEDICPGGDDNVDSDSDGTPDDCDTDRDGDGTPNDDDDFPDDPGEWKDTDKDGIGNNADLDDDGDGVDDRSDACPLDGNESIDTDGDGECDGHDTDDDGDGVEDLYDACPLDNTESIDTDGDGECDGHDTDDDGDGIDDIYDACPLDNSETIDTDGDGLCDGDDSDDDGDGFSDEVDVFPMDESEWADLDGDGIGNNADTDPDGDGIDNLNLSGLGEDECPMTYGTANHLRGCLDSDSDGVSDAIDECPGQIGPGITEGCPDRDGDGYADRVDAYPDDQFRWADTDGDGYADSEDACPDEAGTSSEDRWGCPDSDGDGFSNENDEDPNDAEVTVTPGLVRTALNQKGRVNQECGGGSHFAIAHKPLGSGIVGVGMTAIIHNGQQKIQLYDENGWTSSPTFSQSIPWNEECRSGGGQPELVIDSEGVVHVLYWSSYAPTGLYYVKWDGNEMVTTAVEESNHRHRGTGVGMAVHDGKIHIVWNGGSTANVKYASSTNGIDWNKEDITIGPDANYFGGADVAIGMNGDVHVTFSWYSIFEYSYDGRYAYQGEDGVYYVKKKAGETFTAKCVPSGNGCLVQESHVAQKMAWLVGEPNRFIPEKTGCAHVRGYNRILCNYNHVVRAPKIVASINSPAVHIATAGCNILSEECVTASSMWVFSSLNSGDSWSKTTLSTNSGGVSYDIAMDPYGDLFSSTPHIVYSSGYSWIGGNSKSVTHAVMTEWGKWEQRTVPGASVSGVGLALDRDQYPLIIHGDGNNGQWGESDVQIYITGWDLDGDELPSWKDQCPWIYGLSTDDKPGCQDLDGDGESELNDVSEQADDDTPAIGVLGATIIMVAAATILRPKRREDDGNLVEHGIEVD